MSLFESSSIVKRFRIKIKPKNISTVHNLKINRYYYVITYYELKQLMTQRDIILLCLLICF